MNKGLTILRISLGLTMLFAHGLPKFLKYAQIAPYFPDPIGLGSSLSLSLVIFAELFCSILLITGTAIRFASIPLIITMAVAFFIVHGADPFAKKELALMYLLGYLSILIGGAGAYALTLKSKLPNHPIINWGFDNEDR